MAAANRRTEMDRRTFLGRAFRCAAAAGLALPAAGALRAVAAEGQSPVAIARKGDPAALVRRAVAASGGMGRYVSRGDVVVVKPNIAWDRTPEMAANTNPEVVREVVLLCLEAGARKVRVMDRSCNDPRRCYVKSGIKAAVEAIDDLAVTVEYMDEARFVPLALPKGRSLSSWTVYPGLMEADVRINVPIAKHHSAARLTMGLKNVMGCLGGNRGNIHRDLDGNIAACSAAIPFDLTILDAVRILTGNGPQGGRLSDVRRLDTVIAGVDRVAVDTVGASLFGIGGRDVPHILVAHELGLGQIDASGIHLIEA